MGRGRSDRPSAEFTFGFRLGTRTREIALDRRIGLVLALALPALAIWYLGATLYFVFHDQLLASLMVRQADTQYAYEDRIAALKTQLDREASRGLIDRNTLATTVHDLAAQGARLETRAAEIDALVAQSQRPETPVATSRSLARAPRKSLVEATDNTLLGAPFGSSQPAAASTDRFGAHPLSSSTLRLDRTLDSSSLSPQDGNTINRIATIFETLDETQTDSVTALREPMVRSIRNLQAALAATGLPPRRWGLSALAGDVGGPFVPLSPDFKASFDSNVTLLRDAIKQQATLSEVVDRVPLRRPLDGAAEVTSAFGPRLDPFFGRPAMHTGIDLLGSTGDGVVATAAGVVTIAGSEGGYGNMVEIDHGNGVATRYAHLSAIEVAPHQRVRPGEVVGRIGSTGRTTGPHLHYETRIDGEPVDPARFLRAGSALFRG